MNYIEQNSLYLRHFLNTLGTLSTLSTLGTFLYLRRS